MAVDLNLSDLIVKLIDSYGAMGVALFFCFYYVKITHKKLDDLLTINNKTFGVMLALSSKLRISKDKDND